MDELVDMQNEIKQYFCSKKNIRIPPKYIGIELKKLVDRVTLTILQLLKT